MGKIICLLIVCFVIAGCAKSPYVYTPPPVNTSLSERDVVSGGDGAGAEDETNTLVVDLDKPLLADLRSNWAWAITNGNSDTAGDKLAAVAYASPDALEGLVLAAGPSGLVSIKYQGEKESSGESLQYYPTYDSVSGPYWDVTDGVLAAGLFEEYILIPDSCKKGVLTLTFASVPDGESGDDGFDNHGHPPADPADIEKVAALKNGREIAHSELLASASDGGRVSVFQFENADKGLLVLAYIQGDRVITHEFTADVNNGAASWRDGAEADNICLFKLAMLCETEAGLVIGFSWHGPEGSGRYLLLESAGEFTEFVAEEWLYDHWSDEIITNMEE